MKNINVKIISRKIYEFFLSFSLVSFVTTCMILSFSSGLNIPNEGLKSNALRTFLNVIFVSLTFYILDYVRRKITVDRYVKRITENLDKITAGDFSIEIDKINSPYIENQFDVIIEGINKMTKEINSVETFRADFISNVSHEFKTPLTIIQNYGVLLQDTEIEKEEQKEYARNIVDTSQELANLITNILSLNKLENQQIFPKVKKFNFSEQLFECMLNFEDNINEKELEITIDVDEDIFINSDSELLKIVWNNLFSNAIKFSHIGGKLDLNANMKNGLIITSIADNGVGMDKETGKRIFDKFYQGDTAHATKGNGLGLALVKRIINILDGEITVKSALGSGSIFTVILRNEVLEK
ncbi:MAG: sensor histidine kinase [Anaerocolumna sp.]